MRTFSQYMTGRMFESEINQIAALLVEYQLDPVAVMNDVKLLTEAGGAAAPTAPTPGSPGGPQVQGSSFGSRWFGPGSVMGNVGDWFKKMWQGSGSRPDQHLAAAQRAVGDFVNSMQGVNDHSKPGDNDPVGEMRRQLAGILTFLNDPKTAQAAQIAAQHHQQQAQWGNNAAGVQGTTPAPAPTPGPTPATP